MLNCTTSPILGNLLWMAHLLNMAGVSAVATNLLGHRYLLEKADTVTERLLTASNVDRYLVSVKHLKMGFKWEVRALVFVLVVIQFVLLTPVWWIGAGVGTATLLIMDTIFSIIATIVFLRPITNVVNPQRGRPRCEAQKQLLKTKYMTITGSSLAFFTSTALYVNALLFVLGVGRRSYWLNPYVFDANVDSIFNDTGCFSSVSSVWICQADEIIICRRIFC